MSNSPYDPRLIPGNPEFVQRPATWEKTVAKQIIEIEKLKRERDRWEQMFRRAKVDVESHDAMCVRIWSALGEIDPLKVHELPCDVQLANQLSAERSRRLLAETAVTVCHSAMFGKVNPKHPAWACVYAVQDAATKRLGLQTP